MICSRVIVGRDDSAGHASPHRLAVRIRCDEPQHEVAHHRPALRGRLLVDLLGGLRHRATNAA